MAIDTLGANALASNSVTSAKIADGAVVAADVADGSVTTAKLADDAVTVAKVGAGAIDATALASNAVTTAKVADGAVTQVKTTSVGKNKNVCINGGMQIAQRSTSVSGISSGDTYHTVDRFMTRVGNAGTWTQTQETLAVTDPPFLQHGHTKALKMDCTTANSSLSATSYIIFNYRIEGRDMQQFRTGTSDPAPMTISFWVKATKTGTNTLTTYQDEGGKQVSLAYTISASNTWEHKTLVIPGNTHDYINNDNTRGRQISWNLALGSNRTSGSLQSTWQNYATGDEGPGQVNHADSTANNFHITGIKIEVGNAATDFEHLPIAQELQLCQRYFQIVLDQNRVDVMRKSGTSAGHYLSYFQEMRASPTLSLTRNSTVYGPVNTGAGTGGLDPAQNRSTGFTLYVYTNGTDVQVGAVCTVKANAEL